MKTAFYSRVSTKKQENDRQIHQAETDWIIYEDIASGFHKPFMKRDGAKRLMEDARNGLISTVVISESSRLSRDFLDAIVTLNEFAKLNIQVHILQHSLDMLTEVNGRFMADMKTVLMGAVGWVMAQTESEQNSYRQKTSIEQRKAAGKVNMTPNWDRNGERKSEVRELLLEGHGYTYIAKQAGVAKQTISSVKKQLIKNGEI